MGDCVALDGGVVGGASGEFVHAAEEPLPLPPGLLPPPPLPLPVAPPDPHAMHAPHPGHTADAAAPLTVSTSTRQKPWLLPPTTYVSQPPKDPLKIMLPTHGGSGPDGGCDVGVSPDTGVGTPPSTGASVVPPSTGACVVGKLSSGVGANAGGLVGPGLQAPH
jgi:hypothetical protein